MKKFFLKDSEFGGIQSSSKRNTLQLSTILLFLFVFLNSQIYSQTIPSSGGSARCGNCTPTGWSDVGGTPDISDRNLAGGQGSSGGSATWVSAPLPLPPTGDLTWISMRDVGPNVADESVNTTMGGIVAGKVYILTLYNMSTISNVDGEGSINYSGTYKSLFDYQVGSNPVQQVAQIGHDKWETTEIYFVGDPDGSGNMTFAIQLGQRSLYQADGINRNLIESLHIAVELNALELVDTDGDGIDDTVDIDDDNDGILDVDELTVSGTTYDPLGDEDGDLLPNYLDTRDDNGTSDGSTTDYNDINGDGIPNVYDFDNDGIPNHLDLDSDNDGIPDIIEGQPTNSYITPTGVVGANGLDSAFENNDTPSATSYTVVNTDGTGNADYLDLDSDDDGVDDTTEANLNLSDEVGVNGLDNVYDNGDNYADTNGSFDNTQTDNFPDAGNNAGSGLPEDVDWRDDGTTIQKDTDGDGIPDSTDIDDDNDGIPDVNECTTSSTSASDADSVESSTSVGSAASAIGSDNVRATLNATTDELIIDLGLDVPANTDIEIESRVTDNINHFMKIEESADNVTYSNPVTYTWTATNTEENKLFKLNATARYIRITLSDYGGAGNLEIDNVRYLDFMVECDADGDGIPNILDLDSDNDGIPDNIEAHNSKLCKSFRSRY